MAVVSAVAGGGVCCRKAGCVVWQAAREKDNAMIRIYMCLKFDIALIWRIVDRGFVDTIWCGLETATPL